MEFIDQSEQNVLRNPNRAADLQAVQHGGEGAEVGHQAGQLLQGGVLATREIKLVKERL
jgi:hypothetical protein